MTSPSVEVIVPTYRRPELLHRCLWALRRQTLPPRRVLVVVRSGDIQSVQVVAEHAAGCRLIELVEVDQPGVLAAMRAGVATSTAQILAFTDDDAEPRAEWLAGLVRLLESPDVGGAGGRDVIAGGSQPRSATVGVFSWWGRLPGNHHAGSGWEREVDVLKGVSMAFKVPAFALPGPGMLRGDGAEVHFEVLTCQWAKAQGWKLLYDPRIEVVHAPARREGADRRVRPAPGAVFDAAHNYVLATSTLGGGLRARALIHALVVGSRAEPSLLCAAVAVFRGESEVLRRAVPSMAGKVLGTAKLLTQAFSGASAGRSRLTTAVELRQVAKPRVALVAHDIHQRGGGMERALAELIRFGKDRVDLVVVSADLSEELRPGVEWHRVRVVRRPSPLKFALFWLLAGARLARLNVDLVHTTGAIVGRPADIATVHFCHAAFREVTGGPAPSGGAFWRRVNRRISRVLALAGERWCYRGARLSLLAAVSDSASEELSRYYPGIPVAITPNGVDVARFRPNGGMRSLERAAHGVTPGSIVALFVGGDWSRKGLDLAIEAVALLTRSGDRGVCLWVAGRGERARYFQQAKDLGVADRVQFLGVRTDIEKLYQAADVLVLPSSYETFSLVAYEAAACGLPIVATACHGVAELVGNDEAGVLVERTPHALALALGRLAGDGPLRTRMGEVGRRRCISFTWERSAESVLSLYRTLLARDALSSAIP